MNCGAVTIVGPSLHAIAEVYDDCAGGWRDIDPPVIQGFCLQSTRGVLKKQRDGAWIGVVAESCFAELGQTMAFAFGNWITHGVVVEANGAGPTTADDLGLPGRGEVECVVDQAESAIGEM